MTDIVERLRHEMMPAAMSATRRAILEEAADEIERLRLERGTVIHMSAEIERLRAALALIKVAGIEMVREIARRALEPKP